MRECFHKSKKARRHLISPDTSSQLRKGITGKLKSEINSNLHNKIISKPVNSKDFKNLNKKFKTSILDNNNSNNRINSDTL